jgi:WD40 repeat protein
MSANTRKIDARPDGKHLATASQDGTAKGWDVASGKELLTLKGHAGDPFHYVNNMA